MCVCVADGRRQGREHSENKTEAEGEEMHGVMGKN